jgi:hypothetical protein
MARRTTWIAAGTVALAVVSTKAHAEQPSPADVGAARALGQEGVKLAAAGNCKDAIDRLSRAEKLFHAPTTLARLGECQVQTGRLVEGTENLNRVVRENLPPSAPQVFIRAQERAARLLAEARPRIATLKIAVIAPPEVQIEVKTDGEKVPLASLNTNRPTNPGEYTVEATAPGYRTATAHVKLAEGAVESIALTLEIDPDAPNPPAAAATSPPSDAGAPPPQRSSPSRVPAYAALGVGVIGLGVGTVFGISALSKKSDLDSNCSNKKCPEDQQKTIDSAKTAGTISTVGFIVGGVGVVAGGYLLLAPSEALNAKAALRITPTLGLGHASLSGTF